MKKGSAARSSAAPSAGPITGQVIARPVTQRPSDVADVAVQILETKDNDRAVKIPVPAGKGQQLVNRIRRRIMASVPNWKDAKLRVRRTLGADHVVMWAEKVDGSTKRQAARSAP